MIKKLSIFDLILIIYTIEFELKKGMLYFVLDSISVILDITNMYLISMM
jgi:hypothetical protein